MVTREAGKVQARRVQVTREMSFEMKQDSMRYARTRGCGAFMLK